jgi:hypothetical protein
VNLHDVIRIYMSLRKLKWYLILFQISWFISNLYEFIQIYFEFIWKDDITVCKMTEKDTVDPVPVSAIFYTIYEAIF